ncbi:hypothetical protein [Fusobacterium sp. PH5-44]|uniref:hypothetical protein n=1 Tax=unclassified Fusobacterium TaxID=2648384 RepID=UPI003D215652
MSKASKIYGEEHLNISINGNIVDNSSFSLREFNAILLENEHSSIDIKLEINEEFYAHWRTHTSIVLKDGQVYIPMEISLGGTTYFTGDRRIAKFTRHDDGGLMMHLVFKSKSFLMDKIKRFSVYQNPDITYLDIIKEIENRYKNETINFLGLEDEDLKTILNERIENGLIIQYGETDWEFMKRLVSHFGLALYNSINGSITIGFPSNKLTQSYDSLKGSLWENVDGLRMSRTLITDEMFSLGDGIIDSNGMAVGTICQAYIKYNKNNSKYGSFQSEYLLRTSEHKYRKIHNDNIKGACIYGKVVRIPLEGINKIGEDYSILTVDFLDGLKETVETLNYDKNEEFTVVSGYDNILKNKRIKRYKFPYVTPYTTTKTGFFCAPEVGDVIGIYFPTEVESQGFVIGAVKNPKSIRFSNPFIRNYRTTEVEMDLIEKLNKDVNENIKSVDMENAVIGTDRNLYNMSVAHGNKIMMIKDNFYLEMTTETMKAHESINITSGNTIKIETTDLTVVASGDYNEKANSKTVKLSDKKSTIEKKNEKVGASVTKAKSHQIVIG